MDKVYIYENYKHLTENPPLHNVVDYIFHDCSHELKPIKISIDEIIHAQKIILAVTGLCQKHGEIDYLVTFTK